jgi:hypothetical protein
VRDRVRKTRPLRRDSRAVLPFAQQQKDAVRQIPIQAQARPAVPVLRPGMSHLEARIETARQIV